MQLIVSHDCRNVVLDPLSYCLPDIAWNSAYTWYRFDLWKIASAQPHSTGSSNDVVCGMLVYICCLLAARLDNLKDSIDLEPVVRVL